MTYSLKGRVALRGGLRDFYAPVDEEKQEGAYFRDYGLLRATFGVTFSFRDR